MAADFKLPRRLLAAFLLLLLLSPISCSDSDAPSAAADRGHSAPAVCGWPVESSPSDVNRTKGGVIICAGSYNDENEVSFNENRACPVKMIIRHAAATSDGFPLRWYEAACYCNASRSGNRTAACATVRMPVTRLQPVSDRHGALRLVEETTLRRVDCAALELGPSLPSAAIVLTGKQLRELARQVGAPIFQPVECPTSGGIGELHRRPPRTGFRVSADPGRLPVLLPEARCPCPAHAPVHLPLAVLRPVGSALRVAFEPTPVSCAVLESP